MEGLSPKPHPKVAISDMAESMNEALKLQEAGVQMLFPYSSTVRLATLRLADACTQEWGKLTAARDTLLHVGVTLWCLVVSFSNYLWGSF